MISAKEQGGIEHNYFIQTLQLQTAHKLLNSPYIPSFTECLSQILCRISPLGMLTMIAALKYPMHGLRPPLGHTQAQLLQVSAFLETFQASCMLDIAIH
jgi:hypothetical protein